MSKKKNTTTIIEKVYSPIEDKQISNNLSNSPIWKACYTEEEYKQQSGAFSTMYCYSIKFDGLTPIQVTKIKNVKK